MKRSVALKATKPLLRRTPLTPGGELRRVTPLAQVSAKRLPVLAAKGCRTTFLPAPHRPALPTTVAAALKARSGGVCEIQAPGCARVAVDPSHRKKVGAGGRRGDARTAHNVLSNVLHACRHCHDELHRRPAYARSPGRGWMLTEHQNPASVPALYRGVLVLLTDDGRVLPVGEVAA